jgi:phenylacetate-CoA ligase
MESLTPCVSPPKSNDEIRKIQTERKRHALAQAKRVPFFRGKLDHIRDDRLDDPQEWSKIPILDKDMLRSMSDAEFYKDF